MCLKSLSSLLLLLGTIVVVGVGCTARNTPPAVFQYRNLLEQQKASAQAEDKALKNLPETTASDYETMGDNYLRQGNINMAFIQYDRALRLDPTHTRTRYKMGVLFIKKGLLEDAITVFQEILKGDANHALAYEGIGQALLKMNKLGEAEKNFRQALTVNPELWQSHNFLGMLYERQQRFEEAIAEYRTAIALKPDQGLLYNNLGMAYFFKSDHEQAIIAFREALKTSPSQNKIFNNMGLALGKLGRYEEAFEAFKKGGDEAKAHNNLGVIYLAVGKYQEAIDSFAKAIALSPNYYLKAAENLKTAQKGLAETTPASAATDNTTMSTDRRSPPEQAGRLRESTIPDRFKDGEDSYYAVQVHVFRTKAKADRVVAQYVERGIPASFAPAEGPEGQQWWQIFVGRFGSEAEAEAFGHELSQREGLKEFLVVLRRGAGA